MVLKSKAGTRFRTALDYVIPAVGRTDYRWWTSGIVPDGPPAYAVSLPAPDIDYVIREGIFCAGVANIMLRRVGKRIPTRGDHRFDGGTVAYWGNSTFGPGYFTGHDEPFILEKAKRWARETQSGVLLGRRYRDANHDQGHVAILLPSGYVLQAFPNNWGPDLNWDYTIEQSHAGWYYERMAHPRQWINYKGDEF